MKYRHVKIQDIEIITNEIDKKDVKFYTAITKSENLKRSENYKTLEEAYEILLKLKYNENMQYYITYN